jgi:hypothetical protein
LSLEWSLPGKEDSAGFLLGHQPDRFVLRDGLGVGDRHQRAIPQYGHAIAEASDFVPTVRDEEHDRARIAQACDALGKPGGLAIAKRRSRFIEQEHTRIALNGAHDLEHLLLPERQLADACARIDVETMASENLVRTLAGSLSRDASPRVGRRRGEQEIALDAQLTRQCQFLEYARNALIDGVICVARSDRLAVERDASLIGNDRAADDLDQRRLAGAVLTGKTEDGSTRCFQTDGLERAGCAESLFQSWTNTAWAEAPISQI